MSLEHPKNLIEFQSQALGHLGQALDVDGILGPETEWALDFATLPVRRQSIVRAAQEHLGLVEDPPRSNSDRAGFIRRWLLLCGAEPGDPWCAAYASHCLGVHIGNAILLGKHFPATTQPCAGDVMWFPHEGGVHGHCGIVTGAGATEVMTIEGNSDNAVRSVLRPRAGLFFARTVEDTTGTSPGIVPSLPPAPGGTR